MSNENLPEGWAIPIHDSLTSPVLLFGLPRPAAVTLLTVVMLICLPMGLPFVGVPLGIVTWLLGSWLTRLDPAWFELGRTHLRQPSVYELL